MILRLLAVLWPLVLSGCHKGEEVRADPLGAVRGGAAGSAASATSGSGGSSIGGSSTTQAPIGGSSALGGGTSSTSLASGGLNGFGGATAVTGGTAGAQGDVGPTPYTVFMNDEAYGNIFISALAVDETHVYFAANGGDLLRRRIDATDKVTRFGKWLGTAVGGEIALDQDYVYWLDGGELVRGAKSDGTTARVLLGGASGDVIATSSYVYAAADGCLKVTRMAHGTLNQEVIGAPASVTSPGGGFTYLMLDGTDLYCANGPRVLVSHNWGQLELLTASAGQPVVGLGMFNGELYWMSGRLPINLYRYSSGGQITQVGSLNTSLISRYAIADPPRKRMLFTAGVAVVSMSTETGEWKRLVDSSTGYGVARDANYFYWGRETYTESSIERIPFTLE